MGGQKATDSNALCFTNIQDGLSAVKLVKNGAPTAIDFEISRDGKVFTNYTLGTDILLENKDDSVWIRNTSETPTYFSTNTDAYYQFMMFGSIETSGDISTLLAKNGGIKEMKGAYCFCNLFNSCNALVNAPELPATALTPNCYYGMFGNCKGLKSAPSLPATALADGCYRSMFEGCTSLTAVSALPATTLVQDCYSNMFAGCTSLVTGPSSIGDEGTVMSGSGNCQYMFSGCTSLTGAPELPATTLAYYCYLGMFRDCTSLTTAPSLPATALASCCYESMFSGCKSLTVAPELPATTLTNYCYSHMFRDCTSLTETLALPATALTNNCYRGMFSGCTSLTTAPELPATALAYCCYLGMFRDCTSLTVAPSLPATALADSCYYSMFQGCTSLTAVSALPATTLVQDCYSNMFAGCTSLVTGPSSIGDEGTVMSGSGNCQYMFSGCTSLTVAPELPATTLADYCYNGMFSGCTSLKSITCLAIDKTASNCLANWTSQINTVGKLYTHKDAVWDASQYPSTWTTEISFTPTEWLSMTIEASDVTYLKTKANLKYTCIVNGETSYGTRIENATITGTGISTNSFEINDSEFNVKEREVSFEYQGLTATTTIKQLCKHLMFIAEEDNCTVGFKDSSSKHLEYSSDGETWAASASYSLANKGDYCYVRTSSETTVSYSSPRFTIQGKVVCSGNITYILKKDGNTTNSGNLSSLFLNCTGLLTSPELPATALETGCYSYMFQGCTSLVTGPSSIGGEGTVMSGSNTCYQMFQGCTSLTGAPELPATRLIVSCYAYMFSGCTSLVTGPSSIGGEGTVMSGSGNCQYMFNGCTSLTEAPELSATTLTDSCYLGMFSGCTSLTVAPELPATALASSCYSYMFKDCTSLVTGPSSIGDEGTVMSGSGNCQFMFSGCTSLTGAPELPTTALSDACYRSMFKDCTSLVTGPSSIGGEDTVMSGSGNCQSMFSGCTSLTGAPELPATALTSQCYYQMFAGCKSLTVAPELPATALASQCYQQMFYGCTSLVTGPSSIGDKGTVMSGSGNCQYMFQGCTSLTVAPELPATALADGCYRYMFNGCTSLEYLNTNAKSGMTVNTMGWVTNVHNYGLFYYAMNTEDLWSKDANGIPKSWIARSTFFPSEWYDLVITADDVAGRDSRTTIHYHCLTKGYTIHGEWVEGVEDNGIAISDDFGQNPSTEETRTIPITFVYHGLTASTTITQDVYKSNYYTVDLQNQWQKSSKPNPDESVYDGVYESFSNWHIGNMQAVAKITLFDYTEFTIYIRSYAESSYNYTIASTLDASSVPTDYSISTVKAHTSGNQKSGTAIGDYTKVVYSDIPEGEHFIYVVYRKDGSGDIGDDRGYLLIEKN